MDVSRVEQAKAFVQAHGRDIDRALVAYHFEGGALEDLLAALANYQNPDGGFGHGLEPDVSAPDSNPFATELALAICRDAGVPRDHPLLRRTVDYLEQTQTEEGDWRFSPGVYEHEMAPWFREWQFPNMNPGCTTAGLLKSLGLGSDRLHARSEALFRRKSKPEDLLTGGFYDVRPYAFYLTPEWDYPQRDLYVSGVAWWLIRSHVEGTIEDGTHFFEYARSPETAIGRLLPAEIVEQRLDLLEAEQTEDGGWPISYGDWWRPWVTVHNLLYLRAFGRV